MENRSHRITDWLVLLSIFPVGLFISFIRLRSISADTGFVGIFLGFGELFVLFLAWIGALVLFALASWLLRKDYWFTPKMQYCFVYLLFLIFWFVLPYIL